MPFLKEGRERIVSTSDWDTKKVNPLIHQGKSLLFHPSPFILHPCLSPLPSLIHFLLVGSLYCLRERMVIGMDEKKQRKAFPQWLRRLDPTLEAEDTNAIFQAFRDRRLYHRGGKPFSRFLRRHLLVYTGPVFTTLLCTLFTFFMYHLLGCLGFLLAFGLIPVCYRIFNETIFRKNHLPWYLGSVVSTERVQDQIALDLWLSGVKGHEILECIYLEKRLLEWKWTLVFHLVATTLGIALYLYYRGIQSHLGYAFIGVSFYFSWSLFTLIQRKRAKTISQNILLLINIHLKEQNWSNRYLASLGMGLKKAFQLFVFILSIGFIALIIQGRLILILPDLLFHDNNSFNPHASYLTELLWIILLLLSSATIRRYKKQISESSKLILTQELYQGNYSFEDYIRHRILQDPDAEQLSNNLNWKKE